MQDWYRSRTDGADDGTEALVGLSLRFHLGGDFRRDVEGVLIAALLDDLADAYTRWKRLNRTPRPLVLLDNVHTEAGQAMLDLLLEAPGGTRPRTPRPADRRRCPARRWGRSVPGRPAQCARRDLRDVGMAAGGSGVAVGRAADGASAAAGP